MLYRLGLRLAFLTGEQGGIKGVLVKPKTSVFYPIRAGLYSVIAPGCLSSFRCLLRNNVFVYAIPSHNASTVVTILGKYLGIFQFFGLDL